MKYLLVLLVVIAGLWLLSVQRRRQRGQERQRDSAPENRPKAAAAPARPAPPPMVQCAHCGVHLPLPEAVSSDRLHYCSPQHALAGPNGPSRSE